MVELIEDKRTVKVVDNKLQVTRLMVEEYDAEEYLRMISQLEREQDRLNLDVNKDIRNIIKDIKKEKRENLKAVKKVLKEVLPVKKEAQKIRQEERNNENPN